MVSLLEKFLIPIGSMYGICTYIYHKNQPNVGKYIIHRWCGIWKRNNKNMGKWEKIEEMMTPPQKNGIRCAERIQVKDRVKHIQIQKPVSLIRWKLFEIPLASFDKNVYLVVPETSTFKLVVSVI